MPFQYFKQHRKEKAVRKHLGKFQTELNEDQKKAIMCSLFHLANGDGEYHDKEHEFIVQTSELLGYALPSSGRRMAAEFMQMDKSEFFDQLNTLNEAQKDWFLITTYGMIHSDNKALEEEFNILKVYFGYMNVSMEHFEKVIQESDVFES